tara:strand:+ start:124491 stop:124595 length:105 start_codon:yes stop_codon:yes gene_type:complete
LQSPLPISAHRNWLRGRLNTLPTMMNSPDCPTAP